MPCDIDLQPLYMAYMAYIYMCTAHGSQPGRPAGNALRGFSEDVGLGASTSDLDR